MKQQVMARQEEEEREKNHLLCQEKAREMWRKLRGVTFLLGRYIKLRKGPIQLNVLNVGSCNLTYIGVQWVFHGCKFNKNIMSLDLSDNRMCDKGAIVIAEYLEWVDTLEELNLDKNKMGEETVRLLFKGVHENEGLAALSLQNCALGPVALNWLASYTGKDWYIDDMQLVRNESKAAAGQLIEEYYEEVKTMGKMVDDSLFDEYGDHHQDQERAV